MNVFEKDLRNCFFGIFIKLPSSNAISYSIHIHIQGISNIQTRLFTKENSLKIKKRHLQSQATRDVRQCVFSKFLTRVDSELKKVLCYKNHYYKYYISFLTHTSMCCQPNTHKIIETYRPYLHTFMNIIETY